MAAITASRTSKGGERHLEIWYGTSAANSSDTLSTSADTSVPEGVHRLLYVTCAYSAAPTQAGVTVTLDSNLGAAFDTTLTTGTANAQYTFYLPNGELLIMPDDAIVVSAPAGGAGITASIVIVTERLT